MVLIIFGIIILVVYIEKQTNNPEKKPEGYYTQHPETSGDYIFRCKQLNSIESIANLGTGSSGLEYFEYHNRHLFVKMKDGKTLEGMIDNMSAKFSAYKGNVECKLKSRSTEISIFSVWHLFTEEEWWTIFNILSHCGTTYNLQDYLSTYQLYTTKEGKVTRGVIAAAKLLTKL